MEILSLLREDDREFGLLLFSVCLFCLFWAQINWDSYPPGREQLFDMDQ